MSSIITTEKNKTVMTQSIIKELLITPLIKLWPIIYKNVFGRDKRRSFKVAGDTKGLNELLTAGVTPVDRNCFTFKEKRNQEQEKFNVELIANYVADELIKKFFEKILEC